MSQSDMVIADQPGASFLADLNTVIAALATNSSGATEPETTYAFQWWADIGSTPPMMRQRNAADDGWVAIFNLTTGLQSPAASQAEMEAGTETALRSMSPLLVAQAIASLATSGKPVPVRQTVLNGPVDTNGLAAFGGSTESTTVTATGTLVATASNGFGSNGQVDRVGSITNPSWTSLSTNGTMYLYLDIAANGTCTVGSTTLAPTYRWGGADVVTTNQFTFNIQEMVGKVGNGSVATQTYRVFVGEVTVAGAVVTAITWYALMGRYDSGFTSTLPGATTSVSRNHNLGYSDYVDASLDLKCLASEFGYPVGGIVPNIGSYSAAISPPQTMLTRNAASFPSSNAGNPWALIGSGGGGYQSLTAGNWAYRVRANRRW